MTSPLERGEWSASRPGRALFPGKGPRYPLDRRLGGPRSSLGTKVRDKILLPLPGSNLDRPVVQSVARHYTDWATPAPLDAEARGKTLCCCRASNLGRPVCNWALYFPSYPSISGSTILVRTLATSHQRFRNLFRHLVGLLWTSDRPVAKASTYTGQHTTQKDEDTHALSGIRTHDLSVQAIKAYASDRAATGTCKWWYRRV
jgi:hypothetical protein